MDRIRLTAYTIILVILQLFAGEIVGQVTTNMMIKDEIINQELKESGLSQFITEKPFIYISYTLQMMNPRSSEKKFNDILTVYSLTIENGDKAKLYIKLINMGNNIADTVIGVNIDGYYSDKYYPKAIKWTFKHLKKVLSVKDFIDCSWNNNYNLFSCSILDNPILIISNPMTKEYITWNLHSTLPEKYSDLEERLDALIWYLVILSMKERNEIGSPKIKLPYVYP